jgi:hypothetical protein
MQEQPLLERNHPKTYDQKHLHASVLCGRVSRLKWSSLRTRLLTYYTNLKFKHS